MVTAARRLNAEAESSQGARILFNILWKFYMLTLKKVNQELKALGAEEVLVKGEGYFYFSEGNSTDWQSSSVMVMTLNQLSLDEWIEEWKSLSSNQL